MKGWTTVKVRGYSCLIYYVVLNVSSNFMNNSKTITVSIGELLETSINVCIYLKNLKFMNLPREIKIKS